MEFGLSKRGQRTLLHCNYEYWRLSENSKGHTRWRCCKYEVFHCKAKLWTDGSRIIGEENPEHTHNGNAATSSARKAVGAMKQRMLETVATPSSSQGAVVVGLPDDVLMALPERSTLNRVLRRHRQVALRSTADALPAGPKNLEFVFPSLFQSFLLFDSGPGQDRMIILGDNSLLDGLARADVWLADGTFKVVPGLFFQFPLHTVSIFNFKEE